MADKSSIEWTDATWNPIRGCSRVSEGCRNCYAEHVAARFSGPGQAYEGLATMTKGGARWTGEVRLIEEHLEDPLRWKRPRRIFVNSMSDLFHEKLSDEDIDKVFAVMALSPQHTFQVLTKRAERMHKWFETSSTVWRAWKGKQTEIGVRHDDVSNALYTMFADREVFTDEQMIIQPERWPLPNIWLGVSVEDQETADERIPWMLKTPAAVRWVSYEPALGPVDFKRFLCGLKRVEITSAPGDHTYDLAPKLDWIVCGGESGPHARPMHPAWARSVRDQCVAAGVPFFFKQWGEWAPITVKQHSDEYSRACKTDNWSEVHKQRLLGFPLGEYSHPKVKLPIDAMPYDGRAYVKRLGKKAAGRLLDGREWNEYPNHPNL